MSLEMEIVRALRSHHLGNDGSACPLVATEAAPSATSLSLFASTLDASIRFLATSHTLLSLPICAGCTKPHALHFLVHLPSTISHGVILCE